MSARDRAGGDGGPSVCVIGAGAIGLCCALRLAERGACAVTAIDAAHPAAGSSGLAVGIVETQYLEPLDVELRVRSMRFFDRLERDHGLRIVRNGYLRLGHEEATGAAFARSVEIQRGLGVEDAEVLDRAQLARLVPDMRVDDVCAGLFGPSDGYLDGHLYCALLAELAAGAGVRLLFGRKLQAAERRASGGWRLEVAGETLLCDAVVDAAGPWGARVARLLGCELAVCPQRQQAVAVHLPRTLAYVMPSVMDYAPGDGERGLYFRHEGPGRLIAGLHTEALVDDAADPDGYAHGADQPFLEEVAHKLSDRLPSLADARLAGGWAGLYPVSPTGRPLAGPLCADGSVLAASGGGSGIQLSPALGELVADWVLEGRPRGPVGAESLTPWRPAPPP
jgi:sarcosine oxidase subunit beta